jgi:hypothetical protein
MSEAGDMLGGHDQASLELYLEGVIEWISGYPLGRHYSVNLNAVTDWILRSTWRTW